MPYYTPPGSVHMPPYGHEVMSGGSLSRWRAGVPAPSDSLTPQPESAVVTRPPDAWHGAADIAASPPLSAGGIGDQPSGILTRFSGTPASHQSNIPEHHVLNNPDVFDDAPYIPPRLTQAEIQACPAPDPRGSSVYDRPNYVLPHPYTHEDWTSPAPSQHSLDSNWSASSSSSTSSQRLPGDYLVGDPSRYPQNSLPTHHTYYPAYHGHHRLGLDHIRYGSQPSNTGGPYYRTHSPAYPMVGLSQPEAVDAGSEQVNISPQMNYTATSTQGPSTSSLIPATNQSSSGSTFSVSATTPMDSTCARFPDAGTYLRQQLGLGPHEPISLQSLSDPPSGEKPSTPLPMLIKLAIYGSPNKQLTLQEIYTELENRFQWFRDHKHEKAWKNSIRHNLSLNKVFRHAPRPITEPGKGSYWQLDVSGGEGYKRPRKRRAKNKSVADEEEEEASDMDEDRPGPLDSSGVGRSSSTPIEDVNIDPGLRTEGHVVGEGRARSATRRSGGGSPYLSQSPRYQPGHLPTVAGQDQSTPGQPHVRFGQPSFGQPSFPTHPATRSMTLATTSTSFTALSSSPTAMAPTTSAVARPQPQRMASYDRTAQVPRPQPPPRSGIEYVMEPGGLPAARRVRAYPEARGMDTACSSPETSSDGSTRTWNDTTRSGSDIQG